MKVTVIGGGSTYTPELILGFLNQIDSFPLDEICLMDIDESRLAVVGGFAQRMVNAKGNPFRVTLSTNQRESLRNATYVITQLRVGMMPARRNDEYLGLKHNLIGQETTGIGGMAKALRTIPVILSIAHDISEVAPKALLANFTNPAGLITEALFRYAPHIETVGVCNSGITTKMGMIKLLEKLLKRKIDPHKCILNTLGLNHLTWYSGFSIDGEDFWEQILAEYLKTYNENADSEWDPQTIENLRMIPNSYLSYYYYTDKKIAAQKKWPPSRAESVLEIEKDLLNLYAKQDLIEPPPELMQRGGAYYSTLATELINSHHNNLGQIHIVNTINHGSVNNLPENWVIELPSLIDSKGVHPLPTAPLPPVCYGLVAQVKSYEILTIEAAVHGDRKAAYQALLAHPLGPSADRIANVLNDMLEINKPFLPQFWT